PRLGQALVVQPDAATRADLTEDVLPVAFAALDAVLAKLLTNLVLGVPAELGAISNLVLDLIGPLKLTLKRPLVHRIERRAPRNTDHVRKERVLRAKPVDLRLVLHRHVSPVAIGPSLDGNTRILAGLG